MIFKAGRLLSWAVHNLFDAKMAIRTVALAGFGAVLWLCADFSVCQSLASVFIAYLATGGWKFMKVMIRTFPRDASGVMVLIGAKRLMSKYQNSQQSVPTLFARNVQKHPNKVAFIEVDGRQWTFREVDEYSNAIANFLHEAGFRYGDVIALFYENRPEYVCYWLGMAKIGVCPALINYSLKKDSLAHCINISEGKAVIYSDVHTDAMHDIRGQIPSEMKLYCTGNHTADALKATHIDPLIQRSSTMPPPKEHVMQFNEKLFYIYTSGTTGLPKAAIVINSRFFYMTYSTHKFFKMTPNDIIYDTLPLYHTAGGVLGIGQALIMGCTVVIRKKFSASRFWDDCVRYNCTATQYIGEICRYLLAQPHKPVDRQHRVKMAYGNGLRPQIWTQFQQRFGIGRIGEFYGATEGNANIINIDSTVGAVGFNSRILPRIYPVTLVKVDQDTGELIRGRDGLGIRCEPGEPGELVGKVIQGDPLREFDGYVNKKASDKKLAHDVFAKGDTVFLTGDVLVMDEYGYMYFKDRTGDTFRWRGENVSTMEVEAVVSNIVKLTDACVYGVEVPGIEGRAGMAAIVDEAGTLDLKDLHFKLQSALPPYAHPIFIRSLHKLDTTGTFKLKKTDYRKEGFNPSVVSDQLFYLDGKTRAYQPIDKQVYEDICNGKIRL